MNFSASQISAMKRCRHFWPGERYLTCVGPFFRHARRLNFKVCTIYPVARRNILGTYYFGPMEASLIDSMYDSCVLVMPCVIMEQQINGMNKDMGRQI